MEATRLVTAGLLIAGFVTLFALAPRDDPTKVVTGLPCSILYTIAVVSYDPLHPTAGGAAGRLAKLAQHEMIAAR